MGYRSVYAEEFIAGNTKELGFIECITENFFETEGRPLQLLEKARANYPLAMHGVSLNVGSTDPVSHEYLDKVKDLADRLDPFVVSDHLCWTGAHSKNWYDLFPLPMTQEAIDHVVSKIHQVQEYLHRPLTLENISTYLRFKDDEVPESEFVSEVVRRSGCGLLLDVNNIYVNHYNHGIDAQEYIRSVPAESVQQYHLAGHTNYDTFLFDTHDSPIIDSVWELFEEATEVIGARPVLIERDDNFPEYEELVLELKKANSIIRKASQCEAA